MNQPKNLIITIAFIFISVTAVFAEDMTELTESAMTGDVESQRKLGFHYMNARGTERDYDKAVEWLEKAAGQGCSRSMEALGEVYFYNPEHFGNKSDALEKSISWFEKAVESEGSNRLAASHLYKIYLNGTGTKIDLVKAYAYALVASELSSRDGYVQAVKDRDDKAVRGLEEELSKSKERKGKKLADDILEHCNK